MRRRTKLKNLIRLARRLYSETRQDGRYCGTREEKLHALIQTYHATNKCSLCATAPEKSFSHTADKVLATYGVAAFFLMMALGTLAHLVGGDWRDGPQMSVGPRDSFGWREGGINAGNADWPKFSGMSDWPNWLTPIPGGRMLQVLAVMGRFERGGW